MANRVATLTDQSTFATSTNGRLVQGDIIIDTPFATQGGRGEIYLPNMGATFPSCRVGANIWMYAPTVGNLYSAVMYNNDTIWNKSTQDNPMTIRPLDGQIKFFMNSFSNTGRMWLIADIPHLSINGETDQFPGMKYNWSGFLRGKFGFWISGDTTLSPNPFQIMISGPAGMKSIRLKGIEIEHGYCSLRILPGNTDSTLDLFQAERLYMHDSIDGENFYVGQTLGTPFAKFKKVVIKDIICARAATESIQLQHLLNSGQMSYQENFVSYASAYKWKNPFQQFQDNGVQWMVDEGNNSLRNFIIDGWADSGLSLLSSSVGSPAGELAKIENGLFHDGRRIGMYINGGVNQGVKWLWRNLYFMKFNNTYNELSETPVPTWILSQNNGSDTHSFVNITWDNTKSNLFEAVGNYEVISTTQNNALPSPTYKNSGFPGKKAEQIEQWAQTYASWSVRNGDPVSYNLGDIVALWRQNNFYRFYICISAHTGSAATRPDIAPSLWTLITWDEDGVPSYYTGHQPLDIQSYYPPDDFRLTADSTWNLKGMGLSSNEPNTSYTTYQWFISNDSVGTDMKELAGQTKRVLTKESDDIGKYVRLQVKLRRISFIDTKWVTNWIQLT